MQCCSIPCIRRIAWPLQGPLVPGQVDGFRSHCMRVIHHHVQVSLMSSQPRAALAFFMYGSGIFIFRAHACSHKINSVFLALVVYFTQHACPGPHAAGIHLSLVCHRSEWWSAPGRHWLWVVLYCDSHACSLFVLINSDLFWPSRCWTRGKLYFVLRNSQQDMNTLLSRGFMFLHCASPLCSPSRVRGYLSSSYLFQFDYTDAPFPRTSFACWFQN